jgi:hypothetical protein
LKQNIYKQSAIISLIIFISIFSAGTLPLIEAYIPAVEKKRETFERKISENAVKYIGIQYEFGGDFEKSGTVDNSHLFCLIYAQAAMQSGLVFEGYMPMDMLLKNTEAVERDDLRVGDLMVLIDGLAAMIYKIERRDKFYLIYASEKRREVISFNSQNVVFEAYWLKNLRGYYRISRSILLSPLY